MMGNRKDHIRVRRQRQRKTNCDITPPSNRRIPRRMTSKGRGGGRSGGLKVLGPDRWPPGRCPFRDTWRPRRIRGLRRPRRIRDSGGHGGHGGSGDSGGHGGSGDSGGVRGLRRSSRGADSRGRSGGADSLWGPLGWRGLSWLLWKALARNRHRRALARSGHRRGAGARSGHRRALARIRR